MTPRCQFTTFSLIGIVLVGVVIGVRLNSERSPLQVVIDSAKDKGWPDSSIHVVRHGCNVFESKIDSLEILYFRTKNSRWYCDIHDPIMVRSVDSAILAYLKKFPDEMVGSVLYAKVDTLRNDFPMHSELKRGER